MRIITDIRFIVLMLTCMLVDNVQAGSFRLFPEGLKTEYPAAIFDFVERYLYEIDSLTNAGVDVRRRVADDKVMFIAGGYNTARSIEPSTPFTYGRTDEKYYEFTWQDNAGKELLHIAFPVSFELILGLPKHKIETTMRTSLQRQTASMADSQDDAPDIESMMQAANGLYIPINSRIFEIEDISDRTYYRKSADGLLTPVFSNELKYESAANMLHGLISDVANYKLYIEQNEYDFKKETYTVQLTQWLNYCREIRAVVYIGLEEEREDGLKLLLLARSGDLGFQHMLSLVVPWNFVEKKDAVLKGKLNAYIPTNNVKALYEEYMPKTKLNIKTR